jgi:hypothetical protein
MARQRRIAVANYPNHLVQRGHNRRDMFEERGKSEGASPALFCPSSFLLSLSSLSATRTDLYSFCE